MLFEATCEERWFLNAIELADELIDRFADEERGGFFSSAADGEALIARRKDLDDAPIPSGGASAASGLLRLAQLTGEERYERHAALGASRCCTRSRRAIRRRSGTCFRSSTGTCPPPGRCRARCRSGRAG